MILFVRVEDTGEVRSGRRGFQAEASGSRICRASRASSSHMSQLSPALVAESAASRAGC